MYLASDGWFQVVSHVLSFTLAPRMGVVTCVLCLVFFLSFFLSFVFFACSLALLCCVFVVCSSREACELSVGTRVSTEGGCSHMRAHPFSLSCVHVYMQVVSYASWCRCGCYDAVCYGAV